MSVVIWLLAWSPVVLGVPTVLILCAVQSRKHSNTYARAACALKTRADD